MIRDDGCRKKLSKEGKMERSERRLVVDPLGHEKESILVFPVKGYTDRHVVAPVLYPQGSAVWSSVSSSAEKNGMTHGFLHPIVISRVLCCRLFSFPAMNSFSSTL